MHAYMYQHHSVLYLVACQLSEVATSVLPNSYSFQSHFYLMNKTYGVIIGDILYLSGRELRAVK
jgi:hypothetical protein